MNIQSDSASKKTGIGETTSTNKANLEDTSMLDHFVLDSIKDIYWAEKHLLKALPRLTKAATSPDLKDAFTRHLEVTQAQIGRLEQVFKMLGKKTQAKKCDAMEVLTNEAESLIEDTEAGTKTRDVAIAMAGQKIKHYEIASYGSLVQIAKTMGKNEIAEILGQTLAEEKEADKLLTSIAENNFNLEYEAEVRLNNPSDKINLDLEEIHSYGHEVFNEKERYDRWLLQPNRALGGQIPSDLLKTYPGREEVMRLIGRIDYGVYS